MLKKPFFQKKKFGILIAVAGACLLLGVIVAPGMMKNTNANLTEALAVKQDIVKYYSFSGNIESGDVQNVLSTTNKPVKKFYVNENDQVQKGDLLYEVDNDSAQSALTSAETTLADAKTTLASSKLSYERNQSLYSTGDVSQLELETARDNYKKAQTAITDAQSRLSQAQKDLEDTKYYAEVSGTVSEIYVDENDSITQGTNIMDIIDYDDLEVKVKVDEYDLSAVSVGSTAEVYFEAMEKTVAGTVSKISRGASVKNGVSYFETTLTLPKDDELRVGLSAEVKVLAENASQVITIPVEAVQYEGATPYVQRYNNAGKLEKVYATVGISDGKNVEIKEGLNEGDRVAYEPSAGKKKTGGGIPGGTGLMGKAESQAGFYYGNYASEEISLQLSEVL
ncbi:efflux RND transporter periplasmic adaptor subunit [Lacrimispora sp. AGF001]|uniref:efflux RND transporter periplasmic adaptor subunit n=1 Tax=Lacrimispora sp. AGF001 TaxID=3401631 RepID=UPI003B42B7B7